MQRQVARAILALLLAGTMAPLALAIAAPAQHACCMRKPMHGPAPDTGIYAALECCSHDCCRTLTVSQWAQAERSQPTHILTATAEARAIPSAGAPAQFADGPLSTRAPPQISIA
jgi:hypothetical protein